jgi:hypothetical protein
MILSQACRRKRMGMILLASGWMTLASAALTPLQNAGPSPAAVTGKGASAQLPAFEVTSVKPNKGDSLKLESQTEPADVIVIDHIEPPSPN